MVNTSWVESSQYVLSITWPTISTLIWWNRQILVVLMIRERDHILCPITHRLIPSRYYTSLLFSLMVKFGPSIINSGIQFSIYSVLRIRSNVPARFLQHWIICSRLSDWPRKIVNSFCTVVNFAKNWSPKFHSVLIFYIEKFANPHHVFSSFHQR